MNKTFNKTSIKQLAERVQGQVRVAAITDLHRHHSGGVVMADDNARGHLLERTLLRQRTFMLNEVSGNKWWDALRIQLEAWAPFAECDFVVQRHKHAAVVWAWDQTAFRQRCNDINVKTRGARVLPESMLFSAPAQAGHAVQLCACHHGYEAQYWADGILKASRYWPAMPSAVDWLNFQRGVKLPIAEQQTELPDAGAIKQPELLSDILPKTFNPAAAQGMQDQAKPWLAMVGGFFIVLLTGIAVIDLYHYNSALDDLQAKREQLEQESAPVLAALDRAMQDKAKIQAIQQVATTPEPLEVLAHVGAQLAGAGTRIRQLDWARNELLLALDAPADGQRADLIRLLENSPWLNRVREVPNSMAYDIQLRAQTLALAQVGPLPVTKVAENEEDATQ